MAGGDKSRLNLKKIEKGNIPKEKISVASTK
jgi:hypothetical protein